MDLKVQKYYCDLLTELDDFVFAVDVLHQTKYGNIDDIKLDVINRLDKVNNILDSIDDSVKQLSPSEYLEFHSLSKFIVNNLFTGVNLNEEAYNKYMTSFQYTLDVFNDNFDIKEYYLSLIDSQRRCH